VIWGVSNITVFKDNGQRNDLLVETRIRVTDFNGQHNFTVHRTDVHTFANREANYNWRINVPVNLPVAGAVIEFRLYDIDALQSDEMVYAPERCCVDDLFRLQLARLNDEDPLLKPMDYEVLFDQPLLEPARESWIRAVFCAPYECLGCPRSLTRTACLPLFDGLSYDDDPDGPDVCSCCACGRRKPKRFLMRPRSVPAKLRTTISLLPKSMANLVPVGQGRDAPDPMPDPKLRVAPGMMFRDPIGYLSIILGRQTCFAIQVGTIACCGLLILSLVLFVIAQIVIAFR